jgi:hypothetical protein
MSGSAQNKKRKAVRKITRKTDRKGRVTLPSDFANCLVALERDGDMLLIRKVRSLLERRYSFKQLMAGVNKDNIHPLVDFGPASAAFPT